MCISPWRTCTWYSRRSTLGLPSASRRGAAGLPFRRLRCVHGRWSAYSWRVCARAQCVIMQESSQLQMHHSQAALYRPSQISPKISLVCAHAQARQHAASSLQHMHPPHAMHMRVSKVTVTECQPYPSLCNQRASREWMRRCSGSWTGRTRTLPLLFLTRNALCNSLTVYVH